ncbi:hypothetical protein [Streptomyces graminilatus]|uniref:hypothetical protein n=1 Tax=Streptomyces graminilatus TaxID=1464070 RepID=UPI0006E4045D|nr:hypothetical protein [Streptomyces graminilatus]
MLRPNALLIGFALGVAVALLTTRFRSRRNRVPLPPSVRTASPELIAAFTLAVAEQVPGIGGCAYASVSVWERNAPDTLVHLYPPHGPSIGCVRLDAAGAGPASARAAEMLAAMDLPAGVLVVPLVGH